MSTNACTFVLELGKQLTSDEFRLLMAIAMTSGSSPSHEDILMPRWKTIFAQTGFTENQCRRLLNGLRSALIVSFVTTDPLLFFIATDPRMHLPIDDNLYIRFGRMDSASNDQPPCNG